MILRLLGHCWPKQIEAGELIPEWADKDGIIPITEGCSEPTLLQRVHNIITAEFISQESAYIPDLNDSVRVNIAPLQKAGLLNSEVIAKKDVDKAISDRAEWRADERRWCREGKLPQPGWWKVL